MRRFLLIIVLSGLTLAGFAQNAKFSAGTQIILDEYKNGSSVDKSSLDLKGKGKTITLQTYGSVSGATKSTTQKVNLSTATTSLYASPFTINGVQKVQCWIKMSDQNYSAIEALGVEITCKFDGVVTADVPLDAIEQLAELDNVEEISVAKNYTPQTYQARIKTNVDDVLYHKADAVAAGLTKAYDGSDVVIGIIDTGIQFNHKMFKDENGHTRIKKAYVYKNNSLNEYTTQSAIEALTYDYSGADHGTHTSSIAGGSDLPMTEYFYDGDTTVTKNVNAIFGGMAPKADLVLCGLAGQLYDSYIGQCIQGIYEYAKNVAHKPCVISISLGSQDGPHDGTGYMANICSQYAGDDCIILYAASNDADTDMYVYGTASSSSPLMSVMDCQYYDNTQSSNYYMVNYKLYGSSVAYARTKSTNLGAKIYIIDVTTNKIVWISNNITSSTTLSTSTSGSYGGSLSSYFSSGSIGLTFSQDSYSKKYYISNSVNNLVTKSYTTSTSTDANGNSINIRTGNYKIGVCYYPTSGSCIIDVWGLSNKRINFEALRATYNNTTYDFIAGSNRCSVSTDATIPTVIPIGSYCSNPYWCASTGYIYGAGGQFDQISDFSSFQAEGYGPLGTVLPCITAPGEMLIAGSNKAYDAGEDWYYYGYDTNNPVVAMAGTSMATPCAAGIVALWLQACKEKGVTATPDYIREVMIKTAIHDSYTEGTYSDNFGNGKIDALAGIQYILGVTGKPVITTDPDEEVVFVDGVINREYTKTVTVTGTNLEGDITATLTDANGVFTISPTSIAQDSGTGTITVTYKPTELRDNPYTATITLTSTNADAVTISITGTTVPPEIVTDLTAPEVLAFNETIGKTSTQTFGVLAANLYDVVSISVNEEGSNVFSVSPNTLSIEEAEDGATITVTFEPTSPGTYTGTVTISSPGAESCTVTLTGTATKEFPDTAKVTVNKYGLSTLYLDYPVTIPYEDYEDDLLGVFYAYKYENNELKLARIKNNIPAYTGVIVMGNSGTYGFPRLKTGVAEPLKYTNLLSGSVEAITAAEAKARENMTGDVLTLGKGSQGYVGFYRWNGNDNPNSKLTPYKAYFIIPEEAQGAQFVSIGGFGGEFTGISEVGLSIGEGAWYTIQGMRLESKPHQSGIYIHNGKAVVVK